MNNNFKKITAITLILLMIVGLTACGSDGTESKHLYVYNWGEYIDTALLETFKERTGIEVIYEEFATNEDMYVKLKNGGTQYDLIFPSDYMIEKLINEDMLEEIDMTKIKNYKYIGEQYKNLAYDPDNKYSIPYFWGTAGILYNKTLVSEPVDSWGILFDKKYSGQIFMLDSQRDSLMIALKLLGYSMNTTNEKELEEAKNLLLGQKDIVLSYVVDNGNQIMVQGGAALMPTWNGAAAAMIKDNADLAYALPKEGTNIWYDGICIPKNAEHYEEALAFIDFLLEPEINAANTEYVAYSTPNLEALKLLDPAIQNDEVSYPDITKLENSEVFLDLGDFIKVYNKVWNQIKIQ